MSSTKVPKGYSAEELQQIYELCHDKSVQSQQDEILLQPQIYNRQLFGREFLSKLSAALNHWMKIPTDKLNIIVDSAIMLRDNGILMDTIENENSSCLRRGAAVAHSIFGVAITINASGYGYFLALQKLFELNHADVGKIYTEQIMEIYRGQGMEISWRDDFKCPTEPEYKEMAIRKIGGLFALITRLMHLFTNNDKDLSRLTALLATYYQIREDYCSLKSEKDSEIKSFGEDITEGKFNFLIIHALRERGTGHQVWSILRQRTADDDLKKYCIKLLRESGSFEYARNVLISLDKHIREETAKIGPNTIMECLLDDLLVWNLSNGNQHF